MPQEIFINQKDYKKQTPLSHKAFASNGYTPPSVTSALQEGQIDTLQTPHLKVQGSYEVERINHKGSLKVAYRKREERKSFEVSPESNFKYRLDELVFSLDGESFSFRKLSGGMKLASYIVDRAMTDGTPPLKDKKIHNGVVGIGEAWNQLRLSLNLNGFMGLKVDKVRKIVSFGKNPYAQEWYWGTTDCKDFALCLRYDPFQGWSQVVKNEGQDTYSLIEFGYNIDIPKQLVKQQLDKQKKS